MTPVTIINPMQARGQVEGAVAQGIGTTLFERCMVIDDRGVVINPTSGITASRLLPDIPRTEIFFCEDIRSLRTSWAKLIGEAPIIPIPAALSNALAGTPPVFVLPRSRLAQTESSRNWQKRAVLCINEFTCRLYRHCKGPSRQRRRLYCVERPVRYGCREVSRLHQQRHRAAG